MPHGIATFNPNLQRIAHDAASGERGEQDSIVALVFATMWFEGYVNELVDYLAFDASNGVKLPSKLSALLSVVGELDERRAQLAEKVQLISVVLTGKAFDRGAAPFQDLELLILTRNRLVHSRPHLLHARPEESGSLLVDEPRRLRQGFIERGFITRVGKSGYLPWFMAIHKPAVGKWAVATSYTMARAIADRFPRGSWRRWAHAMNPSTPEAWKGRRSMKLVPRPPA